MTTFDIVGYGEVGPCSCCGYGEHRRLAQVLVGLGRFGRTAHVNSDNGFASSNYLSPMDKPRVAKELQMLGADPDQYRCLRGWESPYA